MRTINEIYDELINHPDYVRSSLWTIQDVVRASDCLVEELYEEEISNLGLDLEELTEKIVRLKKHEISKLIQNWESYSYEYCSWSGEENFSDLLLEGKSILLPTSEPSGGL